jgi:hypothetical protein
MLTVPPSSMCRRVVLADGYQRFVGKFVPTTSLHGVTSHKLVMIRAIYFEIKPEAQMHYAVTRNYRSG